MRIAFVSTNNPNNKVSRSGIPYSIFKQLERYNEVIWINPYNYKLYRYGYFVFCVIMFIAKKIGFKITDHNPYMAKLTDISLRKTMLEGHYDAIFMFAQIDAAYMDYHIPIYVRTDAIFRSAVDYYWSGIPKWFIKQANKLEEEALDKITCLFATSEWIVGEICKYHPKKKYNNIEVVLSGANIDDSYISYPPREYGTKKAIKMLFVGYNLERKGFDIAFETMKLLREEYVRDVTLTVIGGKPTSAQLADSSLIYIGKMDKNKKEDFDKFYAEFSKANLFIFPTRAEFSAIVNCEAAAYALPIFTYDEGGTSSYVIDNYNGRVFNPNVDYTGYAAAIIEAIDNGMMEIYSYNSRKRYDDVLNWNHWGDVVNGCMQKNI